MKERKSLKENYTITMSKILNKKCHIYMKISAILSTDMYFGLACAYISNFKSPSQPFSSLLQTELILISLKYSIQVN